MEVQMDEIAQMKDHLGISAAAAPAAVLLDATDATDRDANIGLGGASSSDWLGLPPDLSAEWLAMPPDPAGPPPEPAGPPADPARPPPDPNGPSRELKKEPKGRKVYLCQRCGQPKKGHICPYATAQPALGPSPEPSESSVPDPAAVAASAAAAVAASAAAAAETALATVGNSWHGVAPTGILNPNCAPSGSTDGPSGQSSRKVYLCGKCDQPKKGKGNWNKWQQHYKKSDESRDGSGGGPRWPKDQGYL